MRFPGKIAVLGGGSWATALAKLLMRNCDSIIWYMRRRDRIDDFTRLRHNPAYLTDVNFDIERIHFTDDINEACSKADTLLFAMPSPYIKEHVDKISVPLESKYILTAIKGIVPGENMLVTDYLHSRFNIARDRMLVISGPCHAEEVALDRPSFLTIGCTDSSRAQAIADLVTSRNSHGIVSHDVDGIEYAGVLKNVYALLSGIIYGLKRGDNLQAVMVSNAIREMDRFLKAAAPADRNITDSVYLGDLLVTAYSRFSRNHNFGTMIGRGYSVRSARMEMEQTAEGYFGTKCMYEINQKLGVEMPILDTVYDILYRQVSAEHAVAGLSSHFT